ncbi:MFS transporter [Actinomycetes bacterium KLBMP 9797]
MYGYCFFDEFVLFYAVYALLFTDTGLGVWQISSLFVLWSAAGIVLEVPSGVLADVVSRRLLLIIGPLLTALGFVLWTVTPSYWAFAAGFLLWGVQGAFQSGALEALVYEELDRLGAADRYARIMGRARAAGTVAVVLAMLAAAPVFTAGGYPAIGLASVLACLASAACAAALPEHRGPRAERDRGYAATLRAGLAEVRGDRRLLGALLLVPAVTAVWGALDEYTPLLIQETGVAAATVPLLLPVIWAGVTVGGLLGGVGERATTRRLAALLGVAGLALAAGAALGHPAGVGLVAVAFCAFQVSTVAADARLQARIAGSSRATVTSLAGLGTDLAGVGTYLAYAAVAAPAGHGATFVVFAAPYLVLALTLMIKASFTSAVV